MAIGSRQGIGVAQRYNLITASAPTRVLDFGGWTDTAFAGNGAVINFACAPRVRAMLRQTEGPENVVSLPDLGERLVHGPATADRHPIVHAALEEFVADRRGLLLTLSSQAPPGASLGTSAAVLIATVGALAQVSGRTLSASEMVALAHQLETRMAGREAGLQDYVPAVKGGVNDITIPRYPSLELETLNPEPQFMTELDARLVVAFLGSHDSSGVHKMVLNDLGGGMAEERLAPLRALVPEVRSAVVAGDIDHFGNLMTKSTLLQADLHPDVFSSGFRDAVALLGDHCVGYKLNGAGGFGGSISLLAASPSAAGEIRARLANAGIGVIETRLGAEGLIVESEDDRK